MRPSQLPETETEILFDKRQDQDICLTLDPIKARVEDDHNLESDFNLAASEPDHQPILEPLQHQD